MVDCYAFLTIQTSHPTLAVEAIVETVLWIPVKIAIVEVSDNAITLAVIL